MVAPQFRHEYLRLPPLAVCSMRSPHSGHAFWSCLMFFESLSVMGIATVIYLALLRAPSISLYDFVFLWTPRSQSISRLCCRSASLSG